MKKIIFILSLALTATICNGQEVIELKEAQVNFKPVTTNVFGKANSFSVNIKETENGEFEKDPVAFMDKYFDINQLLKEIGNNKYESYDVTFRSRKGELNAKFDDKGALLSTFLRFENILVPNALSHQLYRDHKGWEMVKNLHVAKGKNGVMELDYYRITMKNGNKKKTFKINTSDIDKSELAYN